MIYSAFLPFTYTFSTFQKAVNVSLSNSTNNILFVNNTSIRVLNGIHKTIALRYLDKSDGCKDENNTTFQFS